MKQRKPSRTPSDKAKDKVIKVLVETSQNLLDAMELDQPPECGSYYGDRTQNRAKELKAVLVAIAQGK